MSPDAVTAYRGDDPYIFVCYAHADSAEVYGELAWLETCGCRIWYDEGISPAAEWSEELAEKIEHASHFLFFLSEASAASNYCRSELNFARELAKPLLTIHLEETDLSGGIKLQIGTYQAIMKYSLNVDDYRRKVLAGLNLGDAVTTPAKPSPSGTGIRRRSIFAILGLLMVVGIAAIVQLDRQEAPAPVSSIEPTLAEQMPAEPAGDVIERVKEPSIAVLPFDNLSDSPENSYMAAGIQEDILNYLARNEHLLVTSRKSTLRYKDQDVPIKDIASELQVNYVLEGSVRRSDNRVRISVQLIDAERDTHLWSEVYDRELEDIFSMQDEVASGIAQALSVRFELLDEGNPTQSLKAYELFLQALWYHQLQEAQLTDPQTDPRIDILTEVLKIDPQYADAWGFLSRIYSMRVVFGGDAREAVALATDAAQQAIALDPESWQANLAMALITARNAPSTAEPYFQKAIAGNPNHGDARFQYGLWLYNSGRFSEASEQYVESYRRNPLSPQFNLARAMVALHADEQEVAAQYANKALDMSREGVDRVFIGWWAGTIFRSLGMDVEAARQQLATLEVRPNHLRATMELAELAREEYTGNNLWISRAQQIDPDQVNVHTIELRRLTNLGDVKSARDHVDAWLRRDPTNQLARAYDARVRHAEADVAFDKGDISGWRRLARESAEQRLSIATDDDGELRVGPATAWLIVNAAITLKELGDNARAERVVPKVIEFEERQTSKYLRVEALLAIAYGVLGNNEKVLTHLALAADEALSHPAFLDDFFPERRGVYQTLRDDPRFHALRARLERLSIQRMTQLRQQVPELFIPSGE